MAATIGSYTNKQGKSFPTITLKAAGAKADQFGLTMGLSKCRLVLAHFEDIRKFVANAPKPTQGAVPAGGSDDDIVVE